MSDKVLGLFVYLVFLVAVLRLFYLFLRDHGREEMAESYLRGKTDLELGALVSMTRVNGLSSRALNEEVRRRRVLKW